MNEILAAIPAVGGIVAPVLGLAAIGWLWVRVGWDYPLAFVTRLATTLAVPCLIFTALVRTEIAPAALAQLTLASLAAYGVVLVAFWAIGAALRLERRTYLPALAFGNTGNIGLPLAVFAFGPEGLSLAVVVFAVMAVLSFTLGVWLVAGGGSPLAALREPLVGATLLGALFLWQGWTLPAPAMNTLELIGQPRQRRDLRAFQTFVQILVAEPRDRRHKDQHLGHHDENHGQDQDAAGERIQHCA